MFIFSAFFFLTLVWMLDHCRRRHAAEHAVGVPVVSYSAWTATPPREQGEGRRVGRFWGGGRGGGTGDCCGEGQAAATPSAATPRGAGCRPGRAHTSGQLPAYPSLVPPPPSRLVAVAAVGRARGWRSRRGARESRAAAAAARGGGNSAAAGGGAACWAAPRGMGGGGRQRRVAGEPPPAAASAAAVRHAPRIGGRGGRAPPSRGTEWGAPRRAAAGTLVGVGVHGAVAAATRHREGARVLAQSSTGARGGGRHRQTMCMVGCAPSVRTLRWYESTTNTSARTHYPTATRPGYSTDVPRRAQLDSSRAGSTPSLTHSATRSRAVPLSMRARTVQRRAHPLPPALRRSSRFPIRRAIVWPAVVGHAPLCASVSSHCSSPCVGSSHHPASAATRPAVSNSRHPTRAAAGALVDTVTRAAAARPVTRIHRHTGGI